MIDVTFDYNSTNTWPAHAQVLSVLDAKVSEPKVFRIVQTLIDDSVVDIPVTYHREIEIEIDPTIAMANEAYLTSFQTAAFMRVTIGGTNYVVVFQDKGGEKTYPAGGSAFWGYHFKMRTKDVTTL